MNAFRQAWITNFSGIGNGIMIAPVLAAFEQRYPAAKYFHTENRILEDAWFVEQAGLKNLSGFSPSAWRRFNVGDWSSISRFIKDNRIDLIVNLRNEGPDFDRDYYLFKERAGGGYPELRFLDFDFVKLAARDVPENLQLDIRHVLSGSDSEPLPCNVTWLAGLRRDRPESDSIGFGLAASQINKRWPEHKWVALGRLILANAHVQIVLFPGMSDAEVTQAQRVANSIGPQDCRVVIREPLPAVAAKIAHMASFVANDTGLLHMAAASGVPAIGIYTNTNPLIWAPYVRDRFCAFRNEHMSKCEHPKPISGNCLHYYDLCPAIERHGDSIEPSTVATAVMNTLRHPAKP